jgi:hypothetical protein
LIEECKISEAGRKWETEIKKRINIQIMKNGREG